MKDLEFGLIMTLTGMAVTLITLYILMLAIKIMNRLFPEVEKKEEKKQSDG
jgi:Na+-transporting methylmalonyl-CoA/oxaloacetate decarboxylase gamma subunit